MGEPMLLIRLVKHRYKGCLALGSFAFEATKIFVWGV